MKAGVTGGRFWSAAVFSMTPHPRGRLTARESPGRMRGSPRYGLARPQPSLCVPSAPDDAPRHPYSRRRHRAGAHRGDAPRARGDRCRLRLGRAGGGRRRDGDGRNAAARGDARLGQAQQGRAQGPDHDADRHRLPLGERGSPPRARALRVPPPVQDLRGRALALRQRRPRARPREHRGPLRRASSTRPARPRPST